LVDLGQHLGQVERVLHDRAGSLLGVRLAPQWPAGRSRPPPEVSQRTRAGCAHDDDPRVPPPGKVCGTFGEPHSHAAAAIASIRPIGHTASHR
jgi:hypothetical protein